MAPQELGVYGQGLLLRRRLCEQPGGILRRLVHQLLREDARALTEEVFPGLRDGPGTPPDSVRYSSSPGGWQEAA